MRCTARCKNQCRAGRPECGQLLTGWHRTGPLGDASQHHRLAEFGHGEFAPKRRGGRGEGRHARGDVVGDPETVQTASLFGDSTEDRRVAGAESNDVVPVRVGSDDGVGDLIEIQLGGVDQARIGWTVRQHFVGDQAAGVKTYVALGRVVVARGG